MSLQNSVYSSVGTSTVAYGHIPHQLYLKTPDLGPLCVCCIVSVVTGGKAELSACCGGSVAVKPAPHLHFTPLSTAQASSPYPHIGNSI